MRQNQTLLTYIPYTAIDNLAYGYSMRHRLKEGSELMSAGGCGGVPCFALIPIDVAARAGVIATSSKSHWLQVEYTDERGPKQLALKLDKSEYEAIVSAAKSETGRDVEALLENRRE